MQDMGINKLANMFMGNPQPLAQKVQQAQQGVKPGQIPPDLEQAIALQKIQEMRAAAQNQQAMQAGGPQPTVVDRLRQMLQQQPQAQAQPEGTAPPPMQHPMAPQGTPPQGQPPQSQPQGLAAAQPQGIAAAQPQGAPQAHPMPQGLAAAQPQGAPQMPQVQAAHGGSIAQLMSNLGRHYGGGGIVAFATGGDEGLSERDRLRRMEAEYNPAMTAGLTGGTETQPTLQQGQTEAERMRLERMRQDPEALAAAKEARFESQVGGPNLEAERALMEELKAKRAKAQENVNPLMDWARGVAGARPGQKWWQSGLAGSDYADRMAANRESADTAFLKEILGQQSKIGEAERGYKMSKFTLGDTERNRIYNETLEALKAQGVAEDAAKKMAQDVVLQKERLASEEGMAAARNKTSIAAANAPGQAQQVANRILALEKAGDFEGAARLEKLYGSLSGGGNAGVGAERNDIARIRLQMTAAQNVLKDSRATPEQRTKAQADMAELQRQLKTATADKATPGPNEAPVTPLPLPVDATEDKLKDGQIYQTGVGNGRWNAKTRTFTPVN